MDRNSAFTCWGRATSLLVSMAAVSAITYLGITAERPSKSSFQKAGSTSGGCASDVRPEHELVITDLKVVDDVRTSGMGPWSFGGLMARMCPEDQEPGDFLESFLRTWIDSAAGDTTDFYNHDGARQPSTQAADDRAKLLEEYLDSWPRTEGGRLDLTASPLRLLAITNRIDVGEGRFVFNFVEPDNSPEDATLIIEYVLPLQGPNLENWDLNWWAHEWHQLSSMPLGSRQYLDHLESITERFAGRGVSPDRPNGSALGQIRTNEQFGDGTPKDFSSHLVEQKVPVWQMREFRLDFASGQLVVHTCGKTPHLDYNTWYCDETESGLCIETLQQFLIDHQFEILNGTFNWDDQDEILLGLTSSAQSGGFQWLNSAPVPGGISSENWERLRLAFGAQTCNGCHTGDGQTLERDAVNFIFTHISMRYAETESMPSAFLRHDIENVRIPNVLSYVCPKSPAALRANLRQRPVH